MRASLRMVPDGQRAKIFDFVRVALYLRWVIKKEASQLTSLMTVSLRMVPDGQGAKISDFVRVGQYLR